MKLRISESKTTNNLKEDTYRIIYNYDDEEGNVYEGTNDFTGTWDELQTYIKQLRKQDCFNIDATSLNQECLTNKRNRKLKKRIFI